ncbi:MAG: hypothetical protein WD490_02550 [Opitutales bacterium]
MANALAPRTNKSAGSPQTPQPQRGIPTTALDNALGNAPRNAIPPQIPQPQRGIPTTAQGNALGINRPPATQP